MKKMKKCVLTILTVLMLVLTLAVSGCNAESSMSNNKSSKTSSVVTSDSESGETPSTSEGDSKEDEKPSTSESDSKGDENPNPSPDYGELTIANVEVGYGKTAEITPVFSKDSEEITYSYDTSKISIEGNVVTGLVAEAVVEVTATTEHLSDTFTVTVGKNYKFSIADISVDYNGTATINPVFEVEANAETVNYSFEGENISIESGIITGLVQNTTVTVTASTDNYSTTFTVTVGKNYKFTIADVSVDYNGTATIVPVFEVEANAGTISYSYDNSKISIEGNSVTGVIAEAVVTVTATYENCSTTFTVTVGKNYKFTIADVSVDYSGTANITPVFEVEANAGTISYSYDTSKITISDNKVMGEVAEAVVVVTATYENCSTTFTITVGKDYSFAISDVTVGYQENANIEITFTVPDNAGTVTYNYDTSKITISDNKVTGLVAEAVVEVTASYENYTTTFTVTVGKNYKFSIADVSVDYSGTATITPVFEVEANAETVNYSFEGENISIESGVITGLVQNTTVTVTASTANYSTTFTVTVGKDYSFSIENVSVKYNYSVTITPVFTVTDNAENVTYTYAEEGVTIEGNVITGTVANAVVTVTATSEHYTTTFTVTVGEDYGKLTIDNVSAKYGETTTITPIFTTVTEDITYSYDTSKITIEGNVITPLVHEATVQVTAKTTNHEVTFTVTVYTDWGTLTIDDVTIKYGETATINPVFSTFSDDITYSYDGFGVLVNSDGVVSATANADAEVTVTATTTHGVTTFFTVTVGAKKQVTLTITYTGASSNPETHTATLLEEDTYSVNSPAVKGYTADTLVVSGVMDKQDVNVTVTYTANVFNLTYNLLGGTAGASTPTTASYDSLFTIPSPTRSGYKFSGWQVINADYTIATYGSSASQLAILNELVYCYQKGTDNYWDGDVTFKNLTSEAGATITLTATWTSLTKLDGAKDSAGVINSGNVGLSDSAILEIADGLTGTFVLTFSYYQNAVIDETDLSYSNTAWRTGILGLGKYTDWGYYNHIRQDGFSWQGTNPLGTITSSDEDYNADNDYGGMFYGLVQNSYASSSTKFASFVKHSLVTYTIKGYKVGYVGGYLEITQTIKSLGNEYKNQEITIVYDVDLTDGIFFNKGIDVVVNAEDAELSFTSIEYTLTDNNLTHTYVNTSTDAANPTNKWNLMYARTHYAPDTYYEGDFDFTVTYNYTSNNTSSTWSDYCDKHAHIIVYDWDNCSNELFFTAIDFRVDWCADNWGFGDFTYDDNNNSIGEFDTYNTGKFTNGSMNDAMGALMKSASVTARIMRSGNTVYVYMFVCSLNSTTASLVNGYKFTVKDGQKLSFQIVGIESTFTVTTGTTPTITLAGDVLEAGTYGLGTYGVKATQASRAHLALPFPVKQGSVIRFNNQGLGNSTTTNWAVKEFASYFGAKDTTKHSHLLDSDWLDLTIASKEVTQDSFISIGLYNNPDGTATDYSSADEILSLVKACITFEIKLSNNIYQA